MSNEYSESECFALLANRRRRQVLRILAEHESTVSIDELTGRIASREYENPSPEDLRAIRLSLVHNHLPRLEDAEAVSYSAEDGTVELRPSADDLILLRILTQVVNGGSLGPIDEYPDARFSA